MAGNNERRRKRIVLLSEPLDNYYSQSFWQGAFRACERLGYELLHITGGLQIDCSEGIPEEAVGNESRSSIFFHAVDPDLADGVLLWGAQLLHAGTPRILETALARFEGKPIVNLGPEIKGTTSFLADNRSGVRSLVQHLVDAHDIRDIAYFINESSQLNLEAEERYQGYLEGLASRGIGARPDLVVSGSEIEPRMKGLQFQDRHNYVAWSVFAFKRLTEDRGLVPGKDFRAILVRDDFDAVKLMEYLLERGLRIPVDLAVCGYDDLETAASAPSPLTTVRQDFCLHAQKAVELLDRLIRGEPAPTDRVIDANLPVIRESCGCPNRYARSALAPIPPRKGDPGLSARELSLSIVKEALDGGSDPLEALAGILARAKGLIGSGENGLAGEWIGAAAEAADIISRRQSQGFFAADLRRYRLNSLNHLILNSYGIEDIFRTLTASFPQMGVKACRVVAYADGKRPFERDAGLILAYYEGRETECHRPGDRPVPLKNFPLAADNENEFGSGPLILTSLHFANRRLGYALFELANRDCEMPFIISFQLSTALSGSFLVSSLNQKQAELEKAYADIVAISNRDPLTGLQNRRAMQDELAKEKRRLDRYRGKGAPSFSLVFMDLDNFKGYNDRFGHAAGDLVLKLFANLLSSTIRNIDSASRFGGDEFLIVLPQTDSEGASILAGRILKSLAEAKGFQAEISRAIEKEISIPQDELLGCSIGIAEYRPGDDVEKILNAADSALYRAKSEGKNRVVVAPAGEEGG